MRRSLSALAIVGVLLAMAAGASVAETMFTVRCDPDSSRHATGVGGIYKVDPTPVFVEFDTMRMRAEIMGGNSVIPDGHATLNASTSPDLIAIVNPEVGAPSSGSTKLMFSRLTGKADFELFPTATAPERPRISIPLTCQRIGRSF